MFNLPLEHSYSKYLRHINKECAKREEREEEKNNLIRTRGEENANRSILSLHPFNLKQTSHHVIRSPAGQALAVVSLSGIPDSTTVCIRRISNRRRWVLLPLLLLLPEPPPPPALPLLGNCYLLLASAEVVSRFILGLPAGRSCWTVPVLIAMYDLEGDRGHVNKSNKKLSSRRIKNLNTCSLSNLGKESNLVKCNSDHGLYPFW